MRDRSQLYIDGAWVAPQGQGVAEVQNPATEECVGRVPLGGEGDVNRAVDAARRANMPTDEANLAGQVAMNAAFWADHGEQLEQRFNAWAAKQ